MIPNFLVLFLASLIPFLFAYIYFHPKVFGGERWFKMANMNEPHLRTPVKPIKLILSMVLNFLLAIGLYNMCVHPAHVFGMVGGDTTAFQTETVRAFMDLYATNHVTFGHGMLHGLLPSFLTFVLPVLGYVVIFEKKSTKYFLVYSAYWIISLVLMGGVISQWGWKLIY